MMFSAQTITLQTRKRVVLSLLAAMLTVIGVTYYRQELRYALPTPRPQGLVQPAFGSHLQTLLPASLLASTPSRPLMLHFYNPDCPCSRFNESHLHEMARQFEGKVNFVLVVPEGSRNAADRFAKSLHCEVQEDKQGRIAAKCGVYSSPQAVILDSAGNLYYRGNYNRSRYCEDPHSEYARLALEAVAANKPLPALPKQATIAYGCALPSTIKL